MAIYNKHKKSDPKPKENRLLISVNVIGSAGPIRFVVREDDPVASVIQTVLKYYAREGRLPLLGSDFNGFLLYCSHSGSDALRPWEKIGIQGVRAFMLCKKPEVGKSEAEAPSPKRWSGSWKSWINKSLIFKVSSH